MIDLMQKYTLSKIRRMDGYDFEDLTSTLIQSLGYKVEQTKKSGDGGIDIIAYSTAPIISGKYLIQCKRHSKPIGEPVLRDLYGVITAENANKGICITDSTFSPKAIDFAKDKQIELIDGDSLIGLISKYLNNEIIAHENPLSMYQEKIIIKIIDLILKYERNLANIRDELVYQKRTSKSKKEILYFEDFKKFFEESGDELQKIQTILQKNIKQYQYVLINSSSSIDMNTVNSTMKNLGSILNEYIKHYKLILHQNMFEEFIPFKKLYIEGLDAIFYGIVKMKKKGLEVIEGSCLSEEFVNGDLNNYVDGNKLDILAEKVEKEREYLSKKHQPLLFKLFDKIGEKLDRLAEKDNHKHSK